jgi:hypothetical protein
MRREARHDVIRKEFDVDGILDFCISSGLCAGIENRD